MPALRKPATVVQPRGTQAKVPKTIWIDPAQWARVEACARYRELPVSVFAAKALIYGTSVAESQDAMEAQGAMRRL